MTTVTENCLVWRTNAQGSQLSSNFWLGGCECYCQLVTENDVYVISLRNASGMRIPDCYIRTFIHIDLPTQGCLYSEKHSNNLIWSCPKQIVDEILGRGATSRQWTISFCASVPITLRQPTNETGILTYSSNLLKTIKSEHKCVQASSTEIPSESLSHDISQLLGNEQFSDVQLRCGDSSFHAHKIILASRSDVFAAMFRNKMVESETGIVDVTDVDTDILDLLLKYVYSGKIPDLSDDTASSLYAAADKYFIRGLKKTCSDWMVGSLTAENCLDFLILAGAHNDASFKDRVDSFVG